MQKAEAPIIKILIVDDSELIGSKIRELLLGIPNLLLLPQVRTANDALKSIMKNQPDVVILDFRLLQGNGFDVLKTIKKDLPGIKTIMLTNSSGESYQKKFKEYGGDIFLDKTKEFSNIAGAVLLLMATS